MRPLMLMFVFAFGSTGCIIELELDPAYVRVGNIEEYESKEIIKEVRSRGVLVYEEYINHTWLEIEFYNSGGLTADDVQAEILFFENHRIIESISVNLPDIRPGATYVYNLNTGFESIHDYSDFEINVYWE